MNILIETLIEYALSHKLMEAYDVCYARNRLLALCKEETYRISDERMPFQQLSEVLDQLTDMVVKKGVIEDTTSSRDAFDSALMDCVMMRPSQLISNFRSMDAKHATDMFYAFSKDSHYIRMDRIAKNISYKVDTPYGKLDITINCSKPEKDPKDIAKAKSLPQTAYPTCVLCKENEGYYGNSGRDGRSNIRLIPITLQNEIWYFQYSPYVYYNEHCIVLSSDHVPMKTCRETFERLLTFVDQFPHYFLGANADLPIVGGSILSHDHYQGGNYTFAMAEASVLEEYDCFQHHGVRVQRLHWPLSVIRLIGKNIESLVDCGDRILSVWRDYSDEACQILARTSQPHNTISTIARKREDHYELDLVLRNNRTSKEHPLGIFHPHEEIHHIKKENIGIIEVMGLAVLPARLKEELQWIKEAILHGDTTHADALNSHHDWIQSMKSRYDFTNENIQEILQQEVGSIFVEGLTHCGVFPLNDAGHAGFKRFMETIKKEEKQSGD